MHDLPFTGTGVYKRIAADIDRCMVDTVGRCTVEKQEIAFFQFVHRIDQLPVIVLGVGMRASAADTHTRFFQTVVDQSGAVKGIRSFITENVRIADLILRAAYDTVNAVCIARIVM